MDYSNLCVLNLHKHPEYLEPCCELINDEWPRSGTARMMSLQASCDTLPTSLILVNNDKILLGHCKLSCIPTIPESCFVETVVISKSMRGKKLGTYLMNKVEEYCRDILQLDMIHLSTKGCEDFYSKLGYVICKPVSKYGCYIPKIVNQQNGISSPTANNNNDDVKTNVPAPPVPPPMPPVPPPMPTYISPDNSIKSVKTFMSKNLRK